MIQVPKCNHKLSAISVISERIFEDTGKRGQIYNCKAARSIFFSYYESLPHIISSDEAVSSYRSCLWCALNVQKQLKINHLLELIVKNRFRYVRNLVLRAIITLHIIWGIYIFATCQRGHEKIGQLSRFLWQNDSIAVVQCSHKPSFFI